MQLLAPTIGVPRAQLRAVYTALCHCEDERARRFRTMKKHRDVKAGQMYARGPNGEIEEVPDYLEPDVVICRRLADYPGQRAPQGAALGELRQVRCRDLFQPAEVPRQAVCLSAVHGLPAAADGELTNGDDCCVRSLVAAPVAARFAVGRGRAPSVSLQPKIRTRRLSRGRSSPAARASRARGARAA